MRKIIIIFSILALMSTFKLWALENSLFKELISATRKTSLTDADLNDLERKYNDKKMLGEGYVYDIQGYTIGEGVIVYLDYDPEVTDYDIVLEIAKSNVKIAKGLEKRQKISFTGIMDDFRQEKLFFSDVIISP